MNAYLNAYASQHLQFCEKFITDKTMPLPSPKIDTELSSVHDRNSLKNIRIPLPMEPIQRLSKLVIYKTKVQKALTNNRDSKEEKYIVKSELWTNTNNSQKTNFKMLPPILYNNLKMFANKIRRMGYLDDISVLKNSDLQIINDQAYFESIRDDKNSKVPILFHIFFIFFAKFITFLPKIAK